MTNMAAIPIFSKNPVKISETEGPMALGFCMQHLGHDPNKIWKDDDLGLTLTFLYVNSYKQNFQNLLVWN